MFRCLRAVPVAVWLLAVSACGGSTATSPTTPDNPSPTPTVTITPSGPNWSFRTEGHSGMGILSPSGSSSTLTALEGAFNPSGAAITAVLNPFGSCFNSDQDRARFTGTRTGQTVQLQSQPLNAQVIQLSGTLSATGGVFEGTYSITGGCGDGRSGRVTGRAVNLTGIWSGTFGEIPTVIDLQAAGTPDANSNYTLSGSVTFSNTSCFPNATITRHTRGRVLFPDVVSGAQRLELIAEVTEDASTMLISFVIVTGSCAELSQGEGRLVRQ